MMLYLVLLEEEGDLSAPAKLLSVNIPSHGEWTAGLGFPDILLIVVVLRGYNDLLRNEVSRVETYTELTNHAHIRSSLQRLHKFLGPRPRNCPQVVNQIYYQNESRLGQINHQTKKLYSKSKREYFKGKLVIQSLSTKTK